MSSGRCDQLNEDRDNFASCYRLQFIWAIRNSRHLSSSTRMTVSDELEKRVSSRGLF